MRSGCGMLMASDLQWRSLAEKTRPNQLAGVSSSIAEQEKLEYDFAATLLVILQ